MYTCIITEEVYCQFKKDIYKKDWKLVTTKVSTDTLKKLAFAVEDFSTQNYYKYAYQFSPLHVLVLH